MVTNISRLWGGKFHLDMIGVGLLIRRAEFGVKIRGKEHTEGHIRRRDFY